MLAPCCKDAYHKDSLSKKEGMSSHSNDSVILSSLPRMLQAMIRLVNALI